MCKDKSSVSDGVQKPKKNPVPKGLTPFTSVTAKQAQEASARARSLRKHMRAKLLEAAINEGIDKYFVKAIKNMDLDAIAVVEKAAKLVGLDFASSDEAAQNIKVEAKTDSTVDTTVKFVLGERPTKG